VAPDPGPKDVSVPPESVRTVVVEGTLAVPAAPALRQTLTDNAWYRGGEATRVLAIDAADGRWLLGYRVRRGEPPEDITADLGAFAGTRVMLTFRAVNAFGAAPGFVLMDQRGVLLAMDLAVYGDPLKADDVPGLLVLRGRGVGSVKTDCFDQRHTSLVFQGDSPVEVAPSQVSPLLVRGVRAAAITLFSWEASSPIHCTDVAGEARAWALWRIE
jgi:hypothetical protein